MAYRFDHTAIVDGNYLGLPSGGEAFMAADEVYVRVPDSTAETFPAAFPSFFPFLGSPVPPVVYNLPQNNVAGDPFFGLSTEELVAADWTGGGGINYTLESMDGSGNFALYQTSGFSNNVYWQSSNGVDASDSFTPPMGHDHYNWAFTFPGVYALEITASGTHATDGFQSATSTFYFAVGDSTPESSLSAVPEPGSGFILLACMSVIGLGSGIRRRFSASRNSRA